MNGPLPPLLDRHRLDWLHVEAIEARAQVKDAEAIAELAAAAYYDALGSHEDAHLATLRAAAAREDAAAQRRMCDDITPKEAA